MSIVGPWLDGARVLDLFAGSGALGLEALSRGAALAEFVEIAPKSLAALRDNAATLGAGDAVRVHRADALRFVQSLPAGSFDIAFADPPYGMRLGTRLAECWLELPFAEIIGIEHRVDEQLPPGGKVRRYGDTALTFYERAHAAP